MSDASVPGAAGLPRHVPSRLAPEPPPRVPTGASRQVAHYLGIALAAEHELRDALVFIAERHEHQFEIANGATTLAGWVAEDLEAARPLVERYGTGPSDRASHVRAALFRETQLGVDAQLADLGDLAILAQLASMNWTILLQGGRELRDRELTEVAAAAREHHRRQLAWLRMQIEHEAPDAICIPHDRKGQARASLPARPQAIASIPSPVWGPLVAGGLLLVVGLLGVLAGRPWLLPSLGPSAVLIAMTPADPASRLYNTIFGHAGGVLAGFAAVALTGAASAPGVITDGELVPARVAAAVIAIALTVALGVALRASHPPAAATTLLVALGAIDTLDKATALMMGVLILAIVGEGARRLRLERRVPAERRAPASSLVGVRLGRALKREPIHR
jgi:hypothetical protein